MAPKGLWQQQSLQGDAEGTQEALPGQGMGGDRDVASHIGGVMDAGGWRKYPREDWSLRTERQHSFASYVL